MEEFRLQYDSIGKNTGKSFTELELMNQPKLGVLISTNIIRMFFNCYKRRMAVIPRNL